MSDLLPPPYNSLPLPLQDTLVRSHVEAEKGWKGLSLADYLKIRSDDGILDVIKAVYERCLIYPAIWSHIDCIFGGWTYAGGHNVSQGFNFTCSNPNALLQAMRLPKAPFCEDLFNVHGPRDSFRELIKAGPGLHVCVTQPPARATHKHDIHIDQFQTVCQKLATGHCNYAVASKEAAKNMKDHMKEAVPWMVGDTLKNIKERAKEEEQRLKKGIEKYKDLL